MVQFYPWLIFWVYLSVRTCEDFLCLVVIVFLHFIVLTIFVFFVLCHWRVLQLLRPCPHISEIFFSSLALRPHVYGEKGHTKHIFSKTLSRVEIFKNAVLLYSCGQTKTEVFENDYVMVLDPV